MSRLILLTFSLLSAGCASASRNAQSLCRAPDDRSAQTLTHVREAILGGGVPTYAPLRTKLGITDLDPRTVDLVSDPEICAQAVAAYERDVREASADRSAHVYRVGHYYFVERNVNDRPPFILVLNGSFRTLEAFGY